MTGDLGIGDQIGGYRITALVGQGGMSSVYRAESLESGAQVALKVLLPELAKSEDFRARFLREARYAAAVEHPNVVRVRSSGEEGGRLFMAMDYVDGTDLKTVLAIEGILDGRRTVELLSQAGAALDAVHAAGMLHRDVKPGNLIVASNGGSRERCLLTDFGLSKNPAQDSRALTAAGDFVGTYYYTAPEQILGREADGRADVYSLGCVLYECLTGAPPFRREIATEVLHAHIEQPPPKPTAERADLPEAVDGIVAKALAKEPRDRYASCSEMIQAMREALGVGPPTEAAAPGPAAVPPQPPPEALRLEVTQGNAAGAVMRVDGELVIGRGAEGEGRLGDDPEISRRHARIFSGGGRLLVEDLGSMNGTLVNGRLLEGPRPLSPGDAIEVGQTTLVVRPAAERPPPLALRLDLDVGAERARITLEGAPEGLVWEDRLWRVEQGR